MSITESVIQEQPSVGKTPSSNAPGRPYVVIALAAVVLGLVVLIMIRAKAHRTRRSSKRKTK